jgi:cytochrome P450
MGAAVTERPSRTLEEVAMADDANKGAFMGHVAPPADLPAHVPPELVYDYEACLDANTLDDPFSMTEEVRTKFPPIFFAKSRNATMGGPGSWVCTRYEDIREVFQNTDRYSSENIFPFQYLVGENFKTVPNAYDPPEHNKYRVLLNPWFAPKEVKALEPNIFKVVNELIDGFEGKGECDVAYGYGRIYPVKVFLNLMGFPQEKLEDFLDWGYAMLHEMGNLERVRWGAKTAIAYLRSYIAEERARPPGDHLTSRIVRGEVDGRPLTDDEIIGAMFFLWIAGLDTVAATTTLMFRHLALDLELQQKLRENPDLIPEAIEEFLRMNPTVNSARAVKEDHVLGGVLMKKGDRVSTLVAAGNFDPAEFEDPRSFRTDRGANRHLTFIAGPHRCLGSHLARRELGIALGEFLRRIPPFRLKPGADRTVVPGLIAMRNLPLVWDAKG